MEIKIEKNYLQEHNEIKKYMDQYKDHILKYGCLIDKKEYNVKKFINYIKRRFKMDI